MHSPDGDVELRISCTESRLTYTLSWGDRRLLSDSPLSLLPDASYKVLSIDAESIDTSWETVWGQFSHPRDRCEQVTLALDASGVRVDLVCRVYNDGVGFRFKVPAQSGIARRPVEFVVAYTAASDFGAYCTAGEREPIGPVALDQLAQEKQKLPILLDAGRDVFVGLLESDLYSAESFRRAATVSAASGASTSTSSAKLTDQGLVTPWRVILLGRQPGALVVSTTPVNLAAECKLDDTSWVKAGKCLWDWRVHGYQAGGFTYGIDAASYKRFIDFAARNNIRYFLIDDTWFEKVEDGRLLIKPEVDLEQVMAYAEEKGVDIILYYDRKKGVSLGDDALFKLYSELGAAGIKYGFMGNNANFTRMAVEQSAENRLLVDFHDGPCPMTGICRTLPNFVTREFCHAQQDSRRAFSPRAYLKMAVVNALSGPLDQNNGAYGLNGINNGERQKGPSKKNSYNSTVASETARTLVTFSGLIVLPDAPEEYEKKSDLFEFIREMPATWDESQVIASKIGEHITTARRTGSQWFVGSVINEEGGGLGIPLDFLDPGRTYQVTYYEDAPDTHYIENRESYQVRTGTVTSEDTVEARMAPGGGHCMWIRPAEAGVDTQE